MGAGTPIAAMVILIGAITLMASMTSLATNSMHALTELTLTINGQHSRAYTRIELSNATLSGDTITLLVKNFGPEVVFLVDRGYKWCSLIISYCSAIGWVTYLLDNYVVLNVTILSSNATYYALNRHFIGPGEGAWITARLPSGAPEIPCGSPAIIIFSTGFGEVSKLVVVRHD